MTDRVHPIADLALQVLSRSPTGLVLSPDAQRHLVAALAGVGSDRAATRAAVKALVSVAHFLHRRNSTAAAHALLEVASTAAEKLRAHSGPRSLDRLHDRARTFARFDGRAQPALAPHVAHVAVRAPSPFRRPPARV